MIPDHYTSYPTQADLAYVLHRKISLIPVSTKSLIHVHGFSSGFDPECIAWFEIMNA